ncbi:hypothetical protein EVAR_39079_1 [Eumeta japonica]|uniref:Uncharacterized protein n=1 Tax=Eumeta variegata TaxID=151549 RepID=A0A4C1WM73_EUMVA|nr:hypothetical protein EVAR_39079_1 [Eumeta japonica]
MQLHSYTIFRNLRVHSSKSDQLDGTEFRPIESKRSVSRNLSFDRKASSIRTVRSWGFHTQPTAGGRMLVDADRIKAARIGDPLGVDLTERACQYVSAGRGIYLFSSFCPLS